MVRAEADKIGEDVFGSLAKQTTGTLFSDNSTVQSSSRIRNLDERSSVSFAGQGQVLDERAGLLSSRLC